MDEFIHRPQLTIIFNTEKESNMVKIKHLIKPRQFGKTWDCIDRSAETGAVIVVRDVATKKHIMRIADERYKNIPEPVVASSLAKDHTLLPSNAKLIIDDADLVLGALLGRQIDTISMVQRDADGIETMSNMQRLMMFGDEMNKDKTGEGYNNGKE